MNTPSSRTLLGRTPLEWFSSLPVFILLLLTLIVGTGEMVHGQLLKLGESMFGDSQVQYFMLRAEPSKPDCDPNVNVDQEMARQAATPANKGADDDIDDLFGDQKAGDPAVLRKSIEQSLAICKAKHDMYAKVMKHQTPQVRAYRTLETSFFGLFQIGTDNRPLILLLMVAIAAITTTLSFHHIGIRPGHYSKDYLLQSAAQVIAAGFLLFSTIRYYQILQNSGVPIEHPVIHYVWMAFFTTLLLINLKRVVMPVKSEHGEGNWTGAILSIPLYAQMSTIAGVYFLIKGHHAGLAIYINQLMELPSIFMNLGLFIWAGMLLKQSRIVDLFMNVLRPWSLSPQLLTYIILLGASVATAYTGASGIFVIAAGGIIYHEVRSAGGSRQFALAATAMSGSLGVVLSPSLLVVGIAALNRQVTTAQLFYWGGFVFALTSTMFFIASQIHRHNRHQKAAIASPFVAIPAMLREMKAVVPFVLVIGAIVMFYSHVLDTPFNEISAPSILPILMLVVLVFDKKLEARNKVQHNFAAVGAAAVQPPPPAHVEHDNTPGYAAQRQNKAGAAVHAATTETVEHVGAYISLMLFTQLVGGMVERSEIMTMAPQHFPNVWLAMTFLVIAKVILGMVMEPLGAIILVSSTLAPMAYANGIEPVHFWMMVLVAFELGYLLPPVALNQLLTRQVVGEAEIDRSDAEVAGLGFYRRYERWILPCAVMSLSLAIVAYGPLAVQQFEFLAPIKHLFVH